MLAPTQRTGQHSPVNVGSSLNLCPIARVNLQYARAGAKYRGMMETE
jgi:hypothetical protein